MDTAYNDWILDSRVHYDRSYGLFAVDFISKWNLVRWNSYRKPQIDHPANHFPSFGNHCFVIRIGGIYFKHVTGH
jgi:hypothetical protein